MNKKTILMTGLLCGLSAPQLSFAADPFTPDPSSAVLNSMNEILNKILTTVTELKENLNNPTPRTLLPATDAATGSDGSSYLSYLTSSAALSMLYNMSGSASSNLLVVTAGQLPAPPAESAISAMTKGEFFWPYNSYASPNTFSGDSGIHVNAKYDVLAPNTPQGLWQTPTAQALFNFLALPSQLTASTSCLPNGSACNLNDTNPVAEINRNTLPLSAAASGILGNLPQANKVFSAEYSQALIPNLNVNTLLNPLAYSGAPAATGTSAGASSSATSTVQISKLGAVGDSQVQQANNFIRYATAQFSPVPSPDPAKYNSAMLNLATKMSVAKYIVQLRTFAAQLSIPISNLNMLMAKRMKTLLKSGSWGPSQAELEFQSATKRIMRKPGSDKAPSQWVKSIQTANPVQLQQEIAILLAEMNYQLYLNRQLQERSLATLSGMNVAMLETLKQSIEPPEGEGSSGPAGS